MVNHYTIDWLSLDKDECLIEPVWIINEHCIRTCCRESGERWKWLFVPDSVPMTDIRNGSLESSSVNWDFMYVLTEAWLRGYSQDWFTKATSLMVPTQLGVGAREQSSLLLAITGGSCNFYEISKPCNFHYLPESISTPEKPTREHFNSQETAAQQGNRVVPLKVQHVQ